MDKYALRRAIIAAVYKFENAVNFGVIAGTSEIILALRHAPPTSEDLQDIRVEWNYLIAKGYLLSVPGYDDYCRLSGEIRSRLAARDPLTGADPLANDERLYGPAALK